MHEKHRSNRIPSRRSGKLISPLIALLIISIAHRAVAQAFDPVNIGSRREIFVDRSLIDSLDGARMHLHEPRPAENVLAFDRPWEGRYCGYVTIIHDADLFRLYYRGLPKAGGDGSDAEVTCYAESPDGINWTKPDLGLFAVDDGQGGQTKNNNVILAGAAPASHNFSPFLDRNPGAASGRKFKALAGTSKSGLLAFASGDGIHWSKIQDGPVITAGAFDSQNVAFWSEAEHRYVAYFRTWSQGDYAGYRGVSRAESDDFIHWSDPVEMSFGDSAREHIYTNQTRPYFRAPHIYIATAARFMPGRRVVTLEAAQELGGDASYSGDCSDTVLMSSRGGALYDRTFMEGFVRPGIGAGNWTSRTNYPALGVVPAGEDEMSMFVQRNYGQPSHHLERLSMRLDGFASIRAPYSGGEMTTRPLVFEGGELVINYATSAAGSVWVELLAEDGGVIEGHGRADCDEIIGDQIERAVTWSGSSDVASVSGRPVRLRFVMRDADLFSFRFR